LRILRHVVQIAVVIYVALFAIRNVEPATLDLVLFSVGPWPLSLLILLAAGAGALGATLVCGLGVARARSQRRVGQRRIAELEQELHGMRTLPLGTPDDDEEPARFGDVTSDATPRDRALHAAE
jgi:uncharacterized integral membrane protein